MKKILLFIFLFGLTGLTDFAQGTPMIKLKSGDEISYETLDITLAKKFVCTDAEGKEVKYKASDVEMAMEGTTGVIKRQVVLMKLKIKPLKNEGTWEEGTTIYNVVVKKGQNMIVSKREVSANYGSINGTMTTSHSTNETYYLIKGTSAKNIEYSSISDEDSIDDLIALFGSCGNVSSLLESYKSGKGKLFKVDLLFRDVEKEYLSNCLEE